MLTKSSSTARPRKPSSTVRNPSTIHITRRRSSRSTSAPLIKEKSSHGSCWAKAIPATRTGSRVREATSSGPATSVTPSPRFDTVLADHSFVYSGPRPLLAKPHTSPSSFWRHSRRRVYAHWPCSELQGGNTRRKGGARQAAVSAGKPRRPPPCSCSRSHVDRRNPDRSLCPQPGGTSNGLVQPCVEEWSRKTSRRADTSRTEQIKKDQENPTAEITNPNEKAPIPVPASKAAFHRVLPRPYSDFATRPIIRMRVAFWSSPNPAPKRTAPNSRITPPSGRQAIPMAQAMRPGASRRRGCLRSPKRPAHQRLAVVVMPTRRR